MEYGRKKGRTWGALAAFVAVLLLVSAPAQGASIKFDQVFLPAGSTISYAGGAAPLIGSDIFFDSITGLGTPLRAGFTLPCVCFLDFTTGPNIFASIDEWEWAPGAPGSFVLTGTILPVDLPGEADDFPGYFGPDPILVGTFVTAKAEEALDQIVFRGLGFDVKIDPLIAYFGLENPFQFVNSEFTTGPTIVDPITFAFSDTLVNADLNNTEVIPEPASSLLIVLGLLGLGLSRARRR